MNTSQESAHTHTCGYCQYHHDPLGLTADSAPSVSVPTTAETFVGSNPGNPSPIKAKSKAKMPREFSSPPPPPEDSGLGSILTDVIEAAVDIATDSSSGSDYSGGGGDFSGGGASGDF